MSKIYVIRRLAFVYNDEYFVEAGAGAIDSYFTDETVAKEAHQQLEIKRLREQNLSEIEPFSYGYDDLMLKLKAYLDTILDEPLLVESTRKKGKFYAPYPTYLPESLTDEQILKIRDIIGMRYYELKTFDADDTDYYIIWLPKLDKPVQADVRMSHSGRTDATTVFFYETKQEALKHVGHHYWYIWQVGLDDTLENLSETPNLLASFIEGRKAFILQDGTLRFARSYSPSSDDLVGINALLKEPLFEIRAISLNEASTIPHDGWEAI